MYIYSGNVLVLMLSAIMLTDVASVGLPEHRLPHFWDAWNQVLVSPASKPSPTPLLRPSLLKSKLGQEASLCLLDKVSSSENGLWVVAFLPSSSLVPYCPWFCIPSSRHPHYPASPAWQCAFIFVHVTPSTQSTLPTHPRSLSFSWWSMCSPH